MELHLGFWICAFEITCLGAIIGGLSGWLLHNYSKSSIAARFQHLWNEKACLRLAGSLGAIVSIFALANWGITLTTLVVTMLIPSLAALPALVTVLLSGIAMARGSAPN
jgi:membrane protein YqaA with SNARE-associated domain